ncbi:hypothetical protein ACFHWS_20925 [Micromonospora sp. LOL_013]|uniref:hypothetical protein n=1 Tax=Micromonospora sp. LOL_013 TaxID=3345414 RepID=UPI003A8B199E
MVGVAGRAQVDLVPAVVGTPDPATYRLRHGGELTVHILDEPTSAGRQLVLYNSGSGEHVGSVAIGDGATWGFLRVSGGQHVKIGAAVRVATAGTAVRTSPRPPRCGSVTGTG